MSSNKYNALEHKQVWRCKQLLLLQQQGACGLPVNLFKSNLVGSFVSGREFIRAADGNFVSGHEFIRAADGSFVSGHEFIRAADGNFVSGHEFIRAADGSFVSGHEFIRAAPSPKFDRALAPVGP